MTRLSRNKRKMVGIKSGKVQIEWKKYSRETQTLRAGCSKAEPKIFAPPQTPFPGARDGQNLISWRWSLPLPTNPVWWGSMHAISSYRGNRPTNTCRPPVANTQTEPITIHWAAKLSAKCNNQKVRKWPQNAVTVCRKKGLAAMAVVVSSQKQCGNGARTHAECGVWMSTVFRRETEAHAVSTRPAQLSSDVHVLVHLLENGTGKLVSVIAATTRTHTHTHGHFSRWTWVSWLPP